MLTLEIGVLVVVAAPRLTAICHRRRASPHLTSLDDLTHLTSASPLQEKSEELHLSLSLFHLHVETVLSSSLSFVIMLIVLLSFVLSLLVLFVGFCFLSL
mmetsp:Transcript_29709/g.44830  ORF Transcript_29709/g.44830 Transcript_29709/m.44830 type:complete len:100 (-) Transcript_29709:201-500(-)